MARQYRHVGIQGSHNLEKALNFDVCLEKALNCMSGLEKALNLLWVALNYDLEGPKSILRTFCG